ncbi:MAG TPA: SDR family NAD(P)-dependent oxidoreductase [Variovorax sp.]|nr:SDR family NAD(P)-dependent oxidoreductase [Variovorax sp.]
MDIQGKVAVVTGGASGLGRGTAQRLLRGGARVAILDLDDTRGQAFAAEHPDHVVYHRVDISDGAAVAAVIDAVQATFGAIHFCINCAGIGSPGRTVGKKGPLPLEDFARVVNVNLMGTFNVVRLAAAKMLNNAPEGKSGERGVIVNTESIAAYEGQMGQAAYSASKAGVVGLTLPVARDLAAYGIRVCTIAPGLFDTPMLAGVPQPVMDQIVNQLEFPKRAGDPDEYAFLAEHIIQNAYLNGAVIRLDAGTRPPPR